MTYFQDFHPSGMSFEDRESESALLSALGRLGLAFASLEQGLGARIEVLLDGVSYPFLPAGDVSFARRVDLVEALAAKEERRARFKVEHLGALELAELMELLRKAGELYRRTMDPSLLGVHLRSEAEPELTAAVMDAADYVMYAESSLDDFLVVEDSLA